MEYQKIINFLDNISNKPSKFRTKNWIKQMINQEGHITPIVTLDLKLQCESLIYGILVMHTYLLKEE